MNHIGQGNKGLSRFTRRSPKVMVMAVATALVVPLAAGVVMAPTASAACLPTIYYSLTSTQIRMPFPGILPVKDGPGGEMTMTVGKTGEVSAQVTVGTSLELNSVLASAKVQIDASLTKTNSTTLTHGFSHVIRPGWFGNMRYVSYGRTVHWTKYRENGNCITSTFLDSGTIRFPGQAEGWFYSETRI